MEIKVQSLENPGMDSEKKELEDNNILVNVKTYLEDAKDDLNQRLQVLPQSLLRLSLFQSGGPPPCLCEVLSPLITICSFFGLFPVTLDRTKCEMSYKWISKPGIVNAIWLIMIFVSSCTLYARVMNFFHVYVVNGTDFYTFGLVFSIQIAASVVIFLCGNWKASKFVQAWNAFHQVVNSLEMEKFTKLKTRIYIIPSYLFLEMLVNGLTEFWGHYGSPVIDAWIVAMLPLAGFLVTFVPGLLTCAYVVMLWIMAEHFKTITLRIGAAVGNNTIPAGSFHRKVSSSSPNELAEKIIKLRLQHEELAAVVRHLEDAFGVQILAIFAATSFGYVAGIYGLIVYSQGLSEDGGFAKMAAAYSIENIYGGVRLLLILFVTQYLMNSAKEPANILNGMETKSYQVQVQVDRFLVKLGNFPVRVRCCDIFTLGNCFLAAAASNVVTYVLVLMQFRLDKCTSSSPPSASNYSTIP